MADNVQLNLGTAGDVAAADDIAGVKYQRVKLSLGADGSATDAEGGSGAAGANTQRVILATDDPAVVALQIIDDWDETDRAKVNLIAGQAGITAGAGAVAANTPRVTLASDDPAVTALQILDNIVAGSEAQVDIVASLPAGTAYVGKVRLTDGTLDSSLVDETGASAVDALAVGGGTPHDSADSGNPLKMGMKAANALPTAVANNDRANALGDLFGRQLVSHIDPAMQTHINKNFTSQQTGIDVWDPASGKKIAVTSIIIGSYGTTAGRLILWFGDNADTTFTQDTDQVLFAGSYAPSATAKPGTVISFAHPVFCTTADRELHITTDAALSVDVTIEGYEW
jgi:hypothetical protein